MDSHVANTPVVTTRSLIIDQVGCISAGQKKMEIEWITLISPFDAPVSLGVDELAEAVMISSM